MANGRRGEIDAEFDGKTYTLCLTLGALAELESGMGANDLVALAERFEAQRLSARDILRIIGCGLRGAGHAVSDADVANMKVSGGTCGLCANRGAPPRRDFRRRCAGTDEGRKPSDAAGRTSVKLVRGARAASQRAPFPFARAMAFGLGVLRLAPHEFWSMTPRELANAAEGVFGRAPGAPTRAALDELMRGFPDGAK